MITEQNRIGLLTFLGSSSSSDLNTYDRTLYMTLTWLSSESETGCWTGTVSKLSGGMGVSNRVVKRAIRKLIEVGAIEKESKYDYRVVPFFWEKTYSSENWEKLYSEFSFDDEDEVVA
jgi:predicted transcriptional regulator